ncbi:MAG TPA: DNA polymerase III subunit delta [Pusillimonas sp.]|uniref:DNA polymerase III subunit delta n=1 Tax=Pusillimonas sp. TaxID=3040095 RepID=UPI002BFDCAD7|nr:DNA polymerase III subunit delta [Pusillimonas sp.]HUH86688.1 DNA polymerase III subunit delta [Pusillimonas sp.]
MARRPDIDTLIRQLEQAGKAGQSLDGLYVITGDEPLLVTEALDSLRSCATKSGYLERSSLVMDARSDWSAVTAATQNVSLFGDKRLIELKIPGGKPGKVGADTLLKLTELSKGSALSDTVVLISLPRLDKTTKNSKWATALQQARAFLEIPSIERNALPDWIQSRLTRQGQRLEPQSLEWMADKVEGNLLAAHQEIQKLGLLYPEGPISPEDVEQAVLDVARYDVFGLRDAMLSGQAARALHILQGLRAEGEGLPLVLWAVGDEIRLLARLSALQAAGQDLGAAMRQQRVFGNRENLLRQTLRRLPAGLWAVAVQHAHDVDRLIKGLKVPGRLDDPWEELARLVLRVATPRSA